MVFFRELYNTVESSAGFKSWSKKPGSSFLFGFFCMADSRADFMKQENWSVDFFSLKTNKIATFYRGKCEESSLLDPSTIVTPFDIGSFSLLTPAKVLDASGVKSFTKVVGVLRQRDDDPVFSLKFLVVPLKLKLVELDAIKGKVLMSTDESLLDFAKR